jgi:hypothetical protein
LHTRAAKNFRGFGDSEMTIDLQKIRIFIRPGNTDLRKAANGLTAIVEKQMTGEPFSGNVYLPDFITFF